MKTGKELWIGDFVFTALQRLGLKYRHNTFGERNALNGSFSDLKREQRCSGIYFHSGVLLLQFRTGWIVL